jgi:hypothetical protein
MPGAASGPGPVAGSSSFRNMGNRTRRKQNSH